MMRPVRITSRYEAAVNEFEAARRRAALQEIMARFSGRPVSLLSYRDVADSLQVVGKAERGHQIIPTAAIVGSVGRYNDFNREFLPRMAQDAERWARVKVAAGNVNDLPPIEVYQVGDSYFVLDGNHRVSIARQEGVDFLEAYVTEVRTRVPFSPEDSSDTLVLKEEYADFLAYTRLDRLRPGADLSLSIPFQYGRLENLIEVHRYFVEEEEGRELAWEEAVTRWYDDAYMPVVEAIREQGILKRFPGRTETDLYVWLSLHRAALEHALDWEIDSDAAVAKLGSNAEIIPRERARSPLPRWWQALVGRFGRHRAGPPLAWAEGRMLDRYSGTLFADLLLWLQGGSIDQASLATAVLVANRERGHLHILHGGSELEEAEVYAEAVEHCRQMGERALISISTVPEAAGTALAARTPLVDLIVTSREQVRGAGANGGAAFLEAGRPLLVGPLPQDGPAQLLLDLMGGSDPKTAVFVATYLAERWQLPLLLLAEGVAPVHRQRIEAYFDLHEIEARPVETVPADSGAETLLIRGTWERRRLRSPRLDAVALARVEEAAGAVLLCP